MKVSRFGRWFALDVLVSPLAFDLTGFGPRGATNCQPLNKFHVTYVHFKKRRGVKRVKGHHINPVNPMRQALSKRKEWGCLP